MKENRKDHKKVEEACTNFSKNIKEVDIPQGEDDVDELRKILDDYKLKTTENFKEV
mgnify:CR=1 FL=1